MTRRILHTLVSSVMLLSLGVVTALGQPCLQSPEGGPGGGACPECPVCPNDEPQQCPEQEQPDLTCDNPVVRSNVRGDLAACVSCGTELRSQCTSCFGSCPNPPSQCCPITSCPNGQHLVDPGSPSCRCANDTDICKEIGASRVNLVTKHSSHIWTNSEKAFSLLTAKGWSNLPTSAKTLSQLSPCLHKAWWACHNRYANWDGSRAPDDGFTSYADKSLRYWALDSCIYAAVTAFNPTTQKVTHNAGGLTVWQSVQNLDSNCQPLEPWKEQLIKDAGCALNTVRFTEWTSPVSLLWTEDVKIKEVESRSRFPLNPDQSGRWFIWRASGLTPLLVWDPEAKGSITTASQLFGTRTWNKEWKNGYEPLSSLDTDKNGWLEGEELKSIHLWFDFDQDGVSDSGEVRALSIVGVEAIGTNPNLTDDKNGHIFADQGFRRKTSNGVITGRSVDWFSDVVDEDLDSAAYLPPLTDESRKRFEVTDAKPNDSVAGIWIWRAIDPNGDELIENLPTGVLTLYAEKNELKGHTIINAKLPPNEGGLREQVLTSRIEGKVSKGGDGLVQLTFNSRTMHEGAVITEARLSGDGTRLLGKTTEEVGPSKDSTTFIWVAERANLDQPVGE